MHASVEQLLNLRDARGGAQDSALALHVAGCERCQLELGRLRAIQAGLQGLPPLQPPAGAWQAVAARHAAARRAPARSPWAWGGAVAAALAISAVLLGLPGKAPEQVPGQAALVVGEEPSAVPRLAAVSGGQAQEDKADLQALMQRSRNLEQLLRAIPAGPQVVSAGTAGTIAALEDRVALIDFQLSLESESQLTPAQQQLLWRERVDLMNSLVQVRYAQAQRVSF